MKKASVIAIITACVILLAGVVTCAVGSSQAKKEGFMLFPQTEDGESVYTYDFTERDINRILIDASDATVTLKSGGEKSYIVIHNYNANYYRLNEENKSISFDEIDDVLSMFKFWEGFSFKGMRYVFAAGIDRSEAHAIEICIADNSDIRSITLNVASGKVEALDITNTGDLNIVAGKCALTVRGVKIGGALSVSLSGGSADVSGVEASSVSVTTDDADAKVSSVKCGRFSINGAKRSLFAENIESTDLVAKATEGAITLSAPTFTSATVETASGPIRIDLPLALSAYSVDITTQSSSIFVNEDKLDGYVYKIAPVADDKTDDTAEPQDGEAEPGEGGEDTAPPEDTQSEEKTVPALIVKSDSGSVDLNTAAETAPAETGDAADTDGGE